MQDLQFCIGKLHQRLTLLESQIGLGPIFNTDSNPYAESVYMRENTSEDPENEGIVEDSYGNSVNSMERAESIFRSLTADHDFFRTLQSREDKINGNLLSELLYTFFSRLNQRYNPRDPIQIYNLYKLEMELKKAFIEKWSSLSYSGDRLVKLITESSPDPSPVRYDLFIDSLCFLVEYVNSNINSTIDRGPIRTINMLTIRNKINIALAELDDINPQSSRSIQNLRQWYYKNRSIVDIDVE
jgi:hypothetical protein